jgi:hypothetical protein
VRHAKPSDCKKQGEKAEAQEKFKAVFDKLLSIKKKHGGGKKEKNAQRYQNRLHLRARRALIFSI